MPQIALPICALLCAFFIAQSCQKTEILQPDPDQLMQFVGHWDHINENTDRIVRAVITKKDINQLSIQLWSFCPPEYCQWEARVTTLDDIRDGALIFTWEEGGISRTQEFSLTSSGKLQLRYRKVQAAPPADLEETIYFSKVKSTTLYEQIERKDALKASLSKAQINGSENELNQLTAGTIVLYQTSEGRLGKMQVRANWQLLTVRWQTWNDDGSVYAGSDYLAIRNHRYYELNRGAETEPDATCQSDLHWNSSGALVRWLVPQCRAKFTVYHLE